jgi:hypothetical protein
MTFCFRRVKVVVVAVGLALTSVAPAWGQDLGSGGGAAPTTGPASGIPTVEESPASGEAVPTSRRSVKLFDGTRSIGSYELSIGPLWSRRVEDSTPITDRRNFERGAPLASEIGVGTVVTTPAAPFFLTGHYKTVLRILDDKSFSWAIFHGEFGGGLLLGPVEPEVRVRLAALSVDIMHAQPSLQMLTPGVVAGLGLHLGSFRVGLTGNIDYLWRWFGPDYVVRSVLLGVRFDAPKKKSPYPGA